jgi:superfamily I DNA/RNA helicase
MTAFTEQQLQILDHRGDLKISAIAGAGKSSTLLAYAQKHSRNKPCLYLAFNRSVKLEAQKSFAAAGLKNVRVETAHSLAWRYLPQTPDKLSNGYRLHELADALRIGHRHDPAYRYALARHALQYVVLYCNHPHSRLEQQNYLHFIDDPESRRFADRRLEDILRLARKLLQAMETGSLPVLHDYYLKQFQLLQPRLPFELLLFDEAQDASAVMLDIFRRQAGTKILVGDTHQQIYRWRHAVNALASLPFAELPLLNSFRFPESLATLARSCLDWKAGIQSDFKAPDIHGLGKMPVKPRSFACLARTNLGLIEAALQFAASEPGASLYFEGGYEAYSFSSTLFWLQDFIKLQNGQKSAVRDPLLASLGSLEGVQRYIEQTGDAHLGMLYQLHIRYGDSLEQRLRALQKRVLPARDKEKADCCFSTVHRAKGMEYDRIQLMPDFISEAKIKKQQDDPKGKADPGRWLEEINLLYVAITRSRGWLQMPDYLFADLDLAGISTYPGLAYNNIPLETSQMAEPWYFQ